MANIRPPILDDLTYIRFLLYYICQPCDVPFSVYVELSRKPVWDLILILTTLDIQDIVWEVGKVWIPGKGGHPRHGRGGHGGGGGIPDLNTGGIAPLHGAIPAPGFGYWQSTRWFFVIGDEIQQWQWTCFLAEFITERVFDTVWGVIDQTPECSEKFGRIGRASFDAFYGGPGPAWRAFGAEKLQYKHGNVDSPTGFIFYFGSDYPPKISRTWVVTVGINFTVTEDDQVIKFEQFVSGHRSDVRDSIEIETGKAGTKNHIVSTATFRAGEAVQWEIYIEHGFIDVKNAHITGLRVAL